MAIGMSRKTTWRCLECVQSVAALPFDHANPSQPDVLTKQQCVHSIRNTRAEVRAETLRYNKFCDKYNIFRLRAVHPR